MRLRSRSGVFGSRQSHGKSTARSRMCARFVSSSRRRSSSRQQEDRVGLGDFDFGRDLDALWGVPAHNRFIVKVNYRLGP